VGGGDYCQRKRGQYERSDPLSLRERIIKPVVKYSKLGLLKLNEKEEKSHELFGLTEGKTGWTL